MPMRHRMRKPMFNFITSEETTFDTIENLSSLPYFSDTAIDFISAFSKEIQKSHSLKGDAEMMSLAFWMRRQHILALKEKYSFTQTRSDRFASGVAFHISPANVHSMFIYSWFISLLCGNKNIVRISPKSKENLSSILEIINKLLEKDQFLEIRKRTILLSYDRSQKATAFLSEICDIRIIWGGNSTINEIRKIPLSPGAKELLFSNKFSLAVLNARAFSDASHDEKNNVVRSFYNDSYQFGQEACSSPRMVYWVGSEGNARDASDCFWKLLDDYVLSQDHGLNLADISKKLFAMQSLALSREDVTVEQVQSNLVTRVQVDDIEEIPESFHVGRGMFFESDVDNFEKVFSFFKKNYQTISYYGFEVESIKRDFYKVNPSGACRFVPIGKALSFNEVWDGFNLFYEYSREVWFE